MYFIDKITHKTLETRKKEGFECLCLSIFSSYGSIFSTVNDKKSNLIDDLFRRDSLYFLESLMYEHDLLD